MNVVIRIGVAGLMAAGVLAQQTAQDRPVFRATGDAVRLDITVTRADGSQVHDLTADAFEVLDNGRPQPIVAFMSGVQPVTIGTVLDVSESNLAAAPQLEAGTLALIGALRPVDRAMVGTLQLSGPLRADAALLRSDLSQLEMDAGSVIWKAIEARAHALRPEPGRRAILIATDGLDLGDSILANVDSVRPMLTLPSTAVLRPMLLSGVRNGLSYRGLDDDAIQLYVVQTGEGRIQPDLRAVAEGSGGRVIDGRTRPSLDAVFVSVLDELRQQYVIAFEPPERDGAVHRLDVRMKDPGLRARHRRAYVAAGSR